MIGILGTFLEPGIKLHHVDGALFHRIIFPSWGLSAELGGVCVDFQRFHDTLTTERRTP